MKRIIFSLVIVAIGYLGFHYTSFEENGKPAAQSRKGGEPAEPQVSSLIPELSKKEQLRMLIESDNASIKFYGIVLDENGNPLPDVEVKWRVLKAGSFAPSLGLPPRADGIVRTDAQGRFSVTETGSSISIESLLKKGYRQGRQMRGSYGYGSKSEPHLPAESKPERFLMVKDGAPSLKKAIIPLKFDWNGLPYEFEVGPKEFSEKIILIPIREAQRPGERGYDWKLILKVKSGQLALGKQGDAPLAPESGYVEEVVLMQHAGPSWISNADALLYLKTTTGKYAEFRITAYTDAGMQDSITGRLSVRWNTNGGRTFE